MKILWLKSELLHPVDRGGRIRTHAMLRELRRHHEITYLCLDDGDRAVDAVARAAEYATRVVTVPHVNATRGGIRFFAEIGASLLSPLPYALWKYRSTAFQEAVLAEVRTGAYDVVVCDFLVPAVNLPAGLPVPTVIFQHNVEAAIWERHATTTSSMARRWLFSLQWQRMRDYEGMACRRFDGVIAVSEADARKLQTDYGLPAVSFVETGVDTEYFAPTDVVRDPNELVFVGAMDWMPNEQGMLWFARDLFPEIARRHPAARLTIVGRNPTGAIRALASDRITVTGTVPDVRPYIARAAAVVVPLQVGGGTRLKIFEAMAMDAPLVATTVGAEGLRIDPGAHYLRADGNAALVDACHRLLKDPAEARALGAAGGAFVRAHFSWSSITAQFTKYLAQVAASNRPTPVTSGM